MKTDIIIMGAGQAGLCFALSLANTNLNIVIIDKQSAEALTNFEPDGRDLALTHNSKKILEDLGVWERIPKEFISSINEAKVLDGNSEYALHFNKDHLDCLGYLVSNHALKKAIYEQSQTANNITTLFGKKTSLISTNDQAAFVVLSDGEKIEASLLVAADGRFSESRSFFNIPVKEYNFKQKAIVCKMEHEQPHHNIAHECFNYGRTLAVLPLSGNVSSIVITAPTEESDLITNYSEEQFNADISRRFKNKLGKMKLIGKRYQYPLVAVYAERFVSKRFALIGDAAVGMHPVTAHGFNLGLKGQNTLAQLIKSAKNSNIGSPILLEKYHSIHNKNCKPLYVGTNAIVHLFTNDSFIPKIIRKIALRVGNNLMPFKKMVIKELTQIKPRTI